MMQKSAAFWPCTQSLMLTFHGGPAGEAASRKILGFAVLPCSAAADAYF